MAEGDRGTARYAAFLSYSHKDEAVARWLHRKLESYRIPKRLAGTEGERGEVPARLTPIFRDREELPAAGDLSEKVRAALAASANLIVICSPNSAPSPWVAKEISAYRALHPGRPVFGAIVEGEPDQCFPSNLVADGAEPLAADLRPGRDGRRLGLLKLVAGLAGVGLDDLIQRDAQRRVRRVTFISVAAVAAMLLMALLTVAALSARAEAERQRADAEGLVEFMLTDLRETLKRVGRVDVLLLVNRRALARYHVEDLRTLPSDSLLRRARILHAIGEDEVTSGNLSDALSVFLEARRITSEQVTRDPKDAKLLLEHARSEYWIGRVYELRRDWDKSLKQYARFATLMDRVIAADPTNPEYMLEVAASAIDLGNVHLNGRADAPSAQRSYEKAVLWFEKAARARPADAGTLRRQANAYAWLADSFFMQELWDESLAARRKQHAILKRLYLADPSSAENQYRFALAQRGVGHSLIKVGSKANARAYLLEAYSSSQRFIKIDPNNAEWLLFGALMGCDLHYSDLDLPRSISHAGLHKSVVEAAKSLARQKDPRGKDFERCLTYWDEFKPKAGLKAQ